MSVLRYLAPVVAIAALALSGCASGTAPAAATAEDLAGYWVPTESYETSPYLHLTEDGEWSGSDGCNTVTGTWSVGEAGALTVEAGPSTLMACEGEALPMYFAQAARARIDGKTLVLADRDDRELVVLEAGVAPSESPEPAADVPAVGTWVGAAPATGTAPELVLEADGKISGTDGCNRLMGGWTAQDDRVVIGPLAGTRMACDGVDTWLSRGETVVVEGSELVVFDVASTEIGRLTRS